MPFVVNVFVSWSPVQHLLVVNRAADGLKVEMAVLWQLVLSVQSCWGGQGCDRKTYTGRRFECGRCGAVCVWTFLSPGEAILPIGV